MRETVTLNVKELKRLMVLSGVGEGQMRVGVGVLSYCMLLVPPGFGFLALPFSAGRSRWVIGISWLPNIRS
jgi:hypothetical protein